MNRYLKLGASCLALAAANAGAVELGLGEGQVILFPYYTVNNGHSTLLQISNGRDEPKAVRFRVVEGSNGRRALDFNIYLRPQETFTTAIVEGPDGLPRLSSGSEACTVPQIPSEGVQLRPFAYTGVGPNAGSDGGSESIARTREGHVEVIEMGEVTSVLRDEILAHNCAALRQAWVGTGTWASNASSNMRSPSGGLSGSASIVDVAKGVIYAVSAVAIDRFSGIVLHSSPSADSPNLSHAAGESSTAPVEARWHVPGVGWVEASWPRSQAIDAVSAVLAQTSVSNSFNAAIGLGADTEWVLSFPTKAFYADNAPGGRVVGEALAPFSGGFLADNPQQSSEVRGGACTFQAIDVTDRAGTANPAIEGEPCTPQSPTCGPARVATCSVTQVLSFGSAAAPDQASPLLGSLRQAPLAPGLGTVSEPLDVADRSLAPAGNFGTGRGTLRFEGNLRPSIEGVVVRGLPVIAFAMERVINSNAQAGRVANYSAALPHSGRRGVVVPATSE